MPISKREAAERIAKLIPEASRDSIVNNASLIESILGEMEAKPESQTPWSPLKNCGSTVTMPDVTPFNLKDIMDAMHEMIKARTIAANELTEDQLASAIYQAIECGDFMRYVVRCDDRQQVVYIPFRLHQELEQERDALKNLMSEFVTKAAELGVSHD